MIDAPLRSVVLACLVMELLTACQRTEPSEARSPARDTTALPSSIPSPLPKVDAVRTPPANTSSPQAKTE